MKEQNPLPLLQILQREKNTLDVQLRRAYNLAFAAILVAIFFAGVAFYLSVELYL